MVVTETLLAFIDRRYSANLAGFVFRADENLTAFFYSVYGPSFLLTRTTSTSVSDTYLPANPQHRAMVTMNPYIL